MARGIKGSGKAKKTAKRRVKTQRRTEPQQSAAPQPDFMERMQHMTDMLASRPQQRLDKSTDSRAMVIGALASVLSDVTTAVQALGGAVIQAPTIMDTESRS